MARAFSEIFCVENAFDAVPMAGRTDSVILSDTAARHGIELTDALVRRFRERYYVCLAEEIQQPGPRKGVMPGIRALLDALSKRSDSFLALLTGNYAEAARIKLAYFDLWRYFACGAYADDAPNRNHLVPFALERARACGAPAATGRDVLVVGDTPHDIACAAAAGARSIAVATGGTDLQTLKASGADVVFQDLSDTDAFLRLLS
jgi:phosphoglycolate phosphatase-like HAD superfamily hydrolase